MAWTIMMASVGWVLLGLLVGLLAALALSGLRRILRGRRLRRRVLDAQDSERRAIGLLERAGFVIEAVQPSTHLTLRCDGEPMRALVRADLLVRRGSRRYVADVKMGVEAPRLTTRATRRQLLEYRFAYAVDGVVLVDMSQERVIHVEFDIPQVFHRPVSRGPWAVVLLVLASGTAVVLGWLGAL